MHRGRGLTRFGPQLAGGSRSEETEYHQNRACQKGDADAGTAASGSPVERSPTASSSRLPRRIMIAPKRKIRHNARRHVWL